MRMISSFLFILSFVVVFSIGLAWSFDEKEDALVFYNKRSHTKIAYIYRHHVTVIPGNSDLVILTPGKPVFMVPYYAQIEKYDEETGIPTIEIMKEKHYPTPAPTPPPQDDEKIIKNLVKKAIAETERR